MTPMYLKPRLVAELKAIFAVLAAHLMVPNAKSNPQEGMSGIFYSAINSLEVLRSTWASADMAWH